MTILMLIVSLCEYLRDATCTWVDILKLGAYAVAREFCEWVQARTNVLSLIVNTRSSLTYLRGFHQVVLP